MKIRTQITRSAKMESFKGLHSELKKNPSSQLGANEGTEEEERHEYNWVVLKLAGHIICFEELEDD